MPGSRLLGFRSFRYKGERTPFALSARKSSANGPAAIAAAMPSPGVPAGEGRRTLNPEVAGSIPAGATPMPTWCNPASIRPCRGRDPGSNPGVGVPGRQSQPGARRNAVPTVWMRGVATWGYPSREAQAVCPIIPIGPAVTDPAGSATSMVRCGIPGDLPKYAPAMRNAATTDQSQLRSRNELYSLMTNCRILSSLSEPTVQRPTGCVLNAQNQGIEPSSAQGAATGYRGTQRPTMPWPSAFDLPVRIRVAA